VARARESVKAPVMAIEAEVEAEIEAAQDMEAADP